MTLSAFIASELQHNFANAASILEYLVRVLYVINSEAL